MEGKVLAIVWFSASLLFIHLRILLRLFRKPTRHLLPDLIENIEEILVELLAGPFAIVCLVNVEQPLAVKIAASLLDPEGRLQRQPPPTFESEPLLGLFEEIGESVVKKTGRAATSGARLAWYQIAWLTLRARWAVVTAGLMGVLSIPAGNAGKAIAQDGATGKGKGKTSLTRTVTIEDQPPPKPVTVNRTVETMVISLPPGPATTVVSNFVVVRNAALQFSLRSNFFPNGSGFNQVGIGPEALPVAGTVRTDTRGNQWAGLIVTPPVGRDASLAITGLKGLTVRTPDRVEINATLQIPKTPLGLRSLMFLQEGRRPDAWVGPTLKCGDATLWAGLRVTGPPGSNFSLMVRY